MDREEKAKVRWNVRYGVEHGICADGSREADKGRVATLQTGSVAVVIMGGACSAGDEPSEMLMIRLERAMAEWWNGQANTVIITTGRESANIMKDILVSHGCPEVRRINHKLNQIKLPTPTRNNHHCFSYHSLG